MKRINIFVLSLLTALFLVPAMAASTSTAVSTVADQGYDLVSYHQQGGPVRGNGDYPVYYKGSAYIFANSENKNAFKDNPEKYLPAYGGYCAFGVSVGKKFISDPLAWKIVDGKLYLNLNQRVSKIWSKDIPGYIKKADLQWPGIKDKSPDEL